MVVRRRRTPLNTIIMEFCHSLESSVRRLQITTGLSKYSIWSTSNSSTTSTSTSTSNKPWKCRQFPPVTTCKSPPTFARRHRRPIRLFLHRVTGRRGGKALNVNMATATPMISWKRSEKEKNPVVAAVAMVVVVHQV